MDTYLANPGRCFRAALGFLVVCLSAGCGVPEVDGADNQPHSMQMLADGGPSKGDGGSGNSGDPCAYWTGFSGQDLVTRMHSHLYDSYEPIQPEQDQGGNRNRYTTARMMMFTQVARYRSPNGRMVSECIYTGETSPQPDRADPDREQLNCEHVMPRARMEDDRDSVLYSHQQSDIHNLMPSVPGANSYRGSLPFGFVASDRELDYLPSVRGNNSTGDKVFEPRPIKRGDVARIIFYFSVRWGIDIGADEEADLKRWHRDDPVDIDERGRNDAVHRLQGTRNAFVDCPDLVDRIADFRGFTILDSDQTLPRP